MNWDQVAGKWKQYKGQAKERWGKLTDDDWSVVEGNRDQLVGRIQQRYGVAKEEAQKQADEFAKALRSDDVEVETTETRKTKAHRAGRR